MEEKRRFNRLICGEQKGTITYAEHKEDVGIINISTGGMRISLYKPLAVGLDVYGEVKVLPQMAPFFVRGRITRILENNGFWEAAVRFDKVSAIPLC